MRRATTRLPASPWSAANTISSAVLRRGYGEGALYGYRVDGDYAPDNGLWFDPSKLLVDPYVTAIDRSFVYDPKLAVFGADTAPLMPKCVVMADRAVERQAPFFEPGGLVYEVSVKAFTKLHPDVPEAQRGTVAALAHPSVIAHLKKIGVDAIELMPIVAWIDERHLQPLGLTNAWGYNPVGLHAARAATLPRWHRGTARYRGDAA